MNAGLASSGGNAPWSYRAPWWLPGGQVQTIWPALAARPHLGPRPVWRRERWTTPDGDFIDLDFTRHPCAAGAPLLVLFHGLEGSSASPYALAFADFAASQGGGRSGSDSSAAVPSKCTAPSARTTARPGC